MRVSLQRFVNLLLAGAFLGVASFAGWYLYWNYQELEALESRLDATERELESVRAEIAARKGRLARLESDPEYIERMIREKLGYARRDELVFRFE